MPQSIHTIFGISLDVDPFVNKSEYVAFRDQLISDLQTRGLDMTDLEVYIHRLLIYTEPIFRGVSTVQARLSNIDVKIKINKRAKSWMWFLNPELSLRMDNNITSKPRRHDLSYTLSGAYCEDHKHYEDYIATVVKSNCPAKHRKLNITGIAYATETFKNEKFVNFDGRVTTKFPFELTRERQLPLVF